MTLQPAFEASGSRPDDPLTRKLARFVPLSSEESAALAALQSAARPVARNREIISAGRKYDSIFVLLQGTAIRYRVLHDGRRQVLNIVLPGDIIGFPACFFEAALYTITAVSDAVVAAVPFARLFALFQAHPRLAATLFCSFSCEAAMYAEHLIDVGRRSALERVAHFLLELLIRLQAIGLADKRSYRMPLTQELLGDALGLSLPHVNRTLRRLRADNLVHIDGQHVEIKDIDRGGEVLKFIGDGLLAIFPVSGKAADIRPACDAALAAAREVRATLAAADALVGINGGDGVGFGVALHIGEVLYGNIGSGNRLDFTCIGPAVNLAARIEKLTGETRRPILVSGEFARHCGDELVPVGEFLLRGFGAAQAVFGLADEGS